MIFSFDIRRLQKWEDNVFRNLPSFEDILAFRAWERYPTGDTRTRHRALSVGSLLKFVVHTRSSLNTRRKLF